MAFRSDLRKMAAGLFLMLSTIFVLVTLASSAVGQDKSEFRVAEDFWKRIVSPDTRKAMAADRQLQRNYLDAVELTADLTKRLADQFGLVPELQQASHSIEKYRRSLAASTNAIARRADDPLASAAASLGSMLGIGGAPAAGATNSTDAGGGILSGITGGISSALSGVGNSLLQDAGGAAMFLGTGLGAGAAQGLNLAPAAMTMQIAAKVATDNGMNATGLNPAIQNAAMGATASLLGSVNVSSLTSGAGVGSLDLNALALSLSQGIGNGTSAGLQLSPQAMAIEPPAGNSTADIAGTFGFGLTKSLASNVNIKSLMSSVGGGGGFDINTITGGQPISMIAMSLATGIGNGASSGLKLTQANLAPPAGNTTADALGAFGFGLTDSVTTNLNTTQLLAMVKNANVGGAVSNINLAQTASSIGTGLGSGAAAGLKLSSAIVGAPDPNAQDIPNVAGNFAFGLTKSVTENVNMSSLASGLSSGGGSALGGATANLDIGRVAQGAAMGLIQGAGDAVNSMGGLQALINGTATMSTTPLPAGNMAFNDSTGGAATGFGQGLGGQGTLVGVQLLSQINVTSLLDGLVNGNASATPGVAAAPRNGTGVVKRNHFLPMEVVRRQAEVGAISTGNSFNLSMVFNADTISSVMQRSIDALSCEGVGGLVLIGLGLIESGTISSSGGNLNTTMIKQVLPKGVMHFTSGGNTYDIDGTIVGDNLDNVMNAANGIIINGSPVIKFAAFLALHIILALLTFVTLVPLVLSLEATRNLLVRVKMSHVLPKIPKWMDIIWLYVMSPLAILALIFGALAGGTSGHFRTVHGVLGLIMIIITLGASATHFLVKQSSPFALQDALVLPQPFKLFHLLTLRTGINQTLLMLVLPTVIAGFADLSSLTICITRVVSLEAAIAFATGLTFLYSVASALASLTLYLGTRDARQAKKARDEESWGKKSLKEKINVVKKESGRKGSIGKDREFERD